MAGAVRRPGDGLRDLARQIEELTQAHAEHSRAWEAVSALTEYLTLRARLSDYEVDDCKPASPVVKGVGHDGSESSSRRHRHGR
jgi:hypothetical protein